MFNRFTARACQARAHCAALGVSPGSHRLTKIREIRLLGSQRLLLLLLLLLGLSASSSAEGRAPRAARRATTARPTALRAAHCCPPARAARIGAASALHRRYIDSHSLKTSSGMPAVMRCTLCMSLPGLGSGLGLGLGLGLALGLGLGLGYS